jgi:hypothetical protein
MEKKANKTARKSSKKQNSQNVIDLVSKSILARNLEAYRRLSE